MEEVEEAVPGICLSPGDELRCGHQAPASTERLMPAAFNLPHPKKIERRLGQAQVDPAAARRYDLVAQLRNEDQVIRSLRPIAIHRDRFANVDVPLGGQGDEAEYAKPGESRRDWEIRHVSQPGHGGGFGQRDIGFLCPYYRDRNNGRRPCRAILKNHPGRNAPAGNAPCTACRCPCNLPGIPPPARPLQKTSAVVHGGEHLATLGDTIAERTGKVGNQGHTGCAPGALTGVR